MKIARILTITILVIASGCIAISSDRPADQERPVEFIAENKANTTYTFEVFVVQRPAKISYTRSDGMKEVDDIDTGVGPYDPGDNYTFTSVELPESARLHGRFVVNPGESNRSTIRDLPHNFAIVVVVYQDENNSVGYVISTNCDDLALAQLRVTSHSWENALSATRACIEKLNI